MLLILQHYNVVLLRYNVILNKYTVQSINRIEEIVKNIIIICPLIHKSTWLFNTLISWFLLVVAKNI